MFSFPIFSELLRDIIQHWFPTFFSFCLFFLPSQSDTSFTIFLQLLYFIGIVCICQWIARKYKVCFCFSSQFLKFHHNSQFLNIMILLIKHLHPYHTTLRASLGIFAHNKSLLNCDNILVTLTHWSWVPTWLRTWALGLLEWQLLWMCGL